MALNRSPCLRKDVGTSHLKETLEFHHGKHHKTYVDNLNNLVLTLNSKQVTGRHHRCLSGGIFNAAQVWNHTLLNRLSPNGGGFSTVPVDAINETSVASALKKSSPRPLSLLGSGWGWLVKPLTANELASTIGAGNPLTEGNTPLLTRDVWDVIADYCNARSITQKLSGSWLTGNVSEQFAK